MIPVLNDREFEKFVLACRECDHGVMEHQISCTKDDGEGNRCLCRMSRRAALQRNVERLLTDRLEEQAQRHRKSLGQAWSAFLELALDTTIDGEYLLDIVFDLNPGLKRTLARLIEEPKVT